MSETRDDPEIFWVDPRQRGILPPATFHISRSLARCLRRADHEVTIDRDFDAVVSACADREETWINRRIARAYGALHRSGHAHSLEIWRGSRLIGGVYGVTLGAAFFGESMFSRARDGSKIALAYLCHRLAAGGFQLFDTQFLTPHLASLGAIEIPRSRFRELLANALAATGDFTGPRTPDAQELIQRSTQTS